MTQRSAQSRQARYEPLPPGTSGLSRAQVQADQGRRLERATVELVAKCGYAGFTVSDISALARVSKTTFYEHFGSKLDCVLHTHDQIVSDSGERVAVAYRSRDGWRERLYAAFEQFMEVIVSDPDAARLVIVEALALGEAASEHHERAARAFELLLRQSFDQAPGGGPVADTTITALVGGMRRLVYAHLGQGTVDRLPGLVHALVGWALSYQLAADAPVAAPRDPRYSAPPVERAREQAPEQAGRRGPRERIMRAVSSLTCEGGYRALTVPAISARAGASNQTFYDQFPDKQAAFLAVFDDGAGRSLAATEAAFSAAPDWPRAVSAGVGALLSFLAGEPAFARLAFGELLAVGEPAVMRSELVLDTFAAFFAGGLKLRPDLSQTHVTAITGGVWSVVHREVSHGQAEQLPQLAPCLTYVILAPFIGAEAAARLTAEPPAGAAALAS